jgi:four helix bundle protein
MKGDDISERLIDVAVRVIRLVQAMPRTVVGRHVGKQLIRCATSAGANYEEARGAESRADFLHKLGVAWKETRESLYWLKITSRATLVKPSLLEGLVQETIELCAILARSRMTAARNAKSPELLQTPRVTET